MQRRLRVIQLVDGQGQRAGGNRCPGLPGLEHLLVELLDLIVDARKLDRAGGAVHHHHRIGHAVQRLHVNPLLVRVGGDLRHLRHRDRPVRADHRRAGIFANGKLRHGSMLS